MSEKNHIDDIFRQGLDNKGLEYSAARWSEMEKLIDSGKRGGFLLKYWYYAAIFLLLISSGILFFFQNNDAPSDKLASSSSHSLAPDPAEKAEQNIPSSADKTTPSAMKDQQVKNEGEKKEPISSSTTEPSEQRNNQPPLKDITGSTPIIYTTATPEMPSTVSEASEQVSFEKQLLILAMPITEASILPSGNSEILPFFNAQNKPLKKPLTLPKRPDFFINPYVNYGSYTLTTLENEASWKKKYEEPQNYMGMGIDFRVSKGNWSMVSGLGVMQLTEKTNYISQLYDYTFDTSYQLVERNFVQRPDGSFAARLERRIDTTSTTSRDTVLCEDCLTRFTYINIPVAIQYGIRKGSFTYFGQAGLNFSFIHKTQGLYSGSGVAGDYENVTKKDVASCMVFAAASLGVKYHIHSSIALNGRYEYNRSLNSMMVRYAQNPALMGLRVGLEWKF